MNTAFRWVLSLAPGLFLTCIGHADVTKTIVVTPGVPTQAVTTWYFASCTKSLGVGSYTPTVAPVHGTLAYSDVSGPVPGCPTGSPSLPASAAFYTWTATSGASCDYFQLHYLLNGQVSSVADVTVRLMGVPPQLTIGTTTLPGATNGVAYTTLLASSGAQGTTSWTVTAGSLPAGFTLGSNGSLSSTGKTPAAAGTYTFTVTASDLCESVSQQFTLTVAGGSCTANASVDPSKISVLPNPDNEFDTSVADGRAVIFPGATLFGAAFPPFGMNIHVDSDAVSYPGASPADISYAFIQILNTWGGNSVYYDYLGKAYDEWFAVSEDATGMHAPPFVDSYNFVPPFPYFPNTLAPLPTGPFIGDSPAVSAPLLDLSLRQLGEVNYTKEFTAYFGCHTPDDETLFPNSDPKHFLRTLAIVKWVVNYSGKIARRCFADSCRYVAFEPDSNAGVKVESTQYFKGTDLAEPETVAPPVANQETRYQWTRP
jgi:hypothetical protein